MKIHAEQRRLRRDDLGHHNMWQQQTWDALD
jgi:hypothetical protein